eukprot:m.345935 g.345935  ORF g.345935 m.345935 type:complete len:294 (-) comp27584_c0_seq1:76-957(-)
MPLSAAVASVLPRAPLHDANRKSEKPKVNHKEKLGARRERVEAPVHPVNSLNNATLYHELPKQARVPPNIDLISIAKRKSLPVPPPPIKKDVSRKSASPTPFMIDMLLHKESKGRPLSVERSASPIIQTPDQCDEGQQHETILSIYKNRLLQVKAANTLAVTSRSLEPVLKHLSRTQDLGLAVDVLPIVTTSLTKGDPSAPSLPACCDILDIWKQLLESPYEDYRLVALLNIEAVLIKWKGELTSNDLDTTMSSQEVQIALLDMSPLIDKMAKRGSRVVRTTANRVTRGIGRI